MIKKLGALILTFSLILCSFLINAPQKTVLADSNHFGGYYEVLENSGELDAGETVGNVSSAVITGVNKIGGTLSKNVSVSVNQNIVTINQLSQSITSEMVLGNYYTLTLNGNKAIDFRYVTKAIRDKNDIGVLKLTSESIPITGYYVLANNLTLANGEENAHDTNGSASGNGLSYQTQGFRGTFDGQGYNIEFWANATGFFGIIGAGSRIKNTGFVNVRFTKQGTYPIIAKGSSLGITESTRAWIENVYIRTGEGEIPEGGITVNGSIPLGLKNVVLEFPGANITHSTGDISVGALWGADYGWWKTTSDGLNMKPNTYPCDHDDVYIIGIIPVMHYKAANTNRPGDADQEQKKGFYVNANGKLSCTWMEGYAENEGVTEDIYNGNKVYTGVRKYNTLALLTEDKTNDYSTFDTKYWGIEEYGIPVWKNGVENQYDLFLSTLAPNTPAAIYLELGGIDTATVGFGLSGISAGDVPLEFEFIKGEEFISIDSETGVITALKEGTSQFYVRCSYNGKNFERKYTVYVDVAEGYEPPKTSGCGTFIVNGGSIGGGALIILSAFAFTLLRRKKQTV